MTGQHEQEERERQRQRSLKPLFETPRADYCAAHGGDGDPEWCFFCLVEGNGVHVHIS